MRMMPGAYGPVPITGCIASIPRLRTGSCASTTSCVRQTSASMQSSATITVASGPEKPPASLSIGAPWNSVEERALPRQAASIRIWTLALAHDGTLWVGTLGGLLRVHNASISKESRISGGILSLKIDERQRLWVGTSGDGLFQIDAPGMISHAAPPTQIASDTVLALAEDGEHNLWVGTQSGLMRFSATGMHITRIPSAINADFGSVFVDTDHSLWVCSRQLIHLDGGKARIANPALRSGRAHPQRNARAVGSLLGWHAGPRRISRRAQWARRPLHDGNWHKLHSRVHRDAA